MTLLLIATRNQHKLDEFRHLLGPRFRYRSLADFANSPHVVEDADIVAITEAHLAYFDAIGAVGPTATEE